MRGVLVGLQAPGRQARARRTPASHCWPAGLGRPLFGHASGRTGATGWI